MTIFSSRDPTDVDSLCIHAPLTGGFLLSGEQRWRHLFGGIASSSLLHHSPLASSLSKLQGVSHLALTYLLFHPRISSITSEVTREKTISPLREDHLPTERGPSPHWASEPSCIADDSELSFCPWDNPLWVQRKRNCKRSGAIAPPQRKDDRHSLGVVLKIIFNSEQNLLILSCMRWDHNNSVLSDQKQFSISVKAPPS